MAQEQQEVVQLEDIQLSADVETLAIEGKIEAAEAEIVVQPLPADPAQAEVDALLAKAKQENASRSRMRSAHLSETECLATAMYHEARGEGERGLKAVAFVIYNRVKSGLFPSSYCQVVLQPSQFSFTADRHPDNIKEWGTYEKVLAMAVELVDNGGFQRTTSPVGGALFFDSFPRVVSRGRRFVATIGNHHFFIR